MDWILHEGRYQSSRWQRRTEEHSPWCSRPGVEDGWGRDGSLQFALSCKQSEQTCRTVTKQYAVSVWHQQMLIIAPCTGAEQSCGRPRCLIVFLSSMATANWFTVFRRPRARSADNGLYRTWAVLPCRLAPKALIVTARERTHTHIRFNSMHRSSVVRAPLWAHVYVCGDGVCVCVCRCIRPVRIAIGERRFSHYAPRIWNSGTRFRWLSDPLTVMTSSRPG